MLRTYRAKFLKSLIGLGLVALHDERKLKAKKMLSAAESKKLKAAGQAIDFVQRRFREFVRHGVVCQGQDLAKLPWWPDSSSSAEITIKIMAHIARASLNMSRFDPDQLDLAGVDLARFTLREMGPRYSL